ncbi:hypothetical protein lerEdw1_001851 [Lerista edwardsae]|nr:hypothetical protein lerEdw1_001851 [Lerista edwardsae]
MNNEEHRSERPYNFTPYYCNLCKIYCASPINLQTHFLGLKHKAVENALKSHGIVKPLGSAGEPLKPQESLPDFVETECERDLGRTLEEQLDSCQDSEPAVGLQYITEHQSGEFPVYTCSLCVCQTGLSNMFMHVLGVKHRLAYLKRHYPEMSNVGGKGASLNKKLKELAARVEEKEGRKEIKVTKDPPAPKDDFSEKEKETPKLEEKETLGGKGNTWRRRQQLILKLQGKETAKETAEKAEEANKVAEAKAQCDNSNKLEKQQDQVQNTEQLKTAELKDCDSVEEFANNEELIKYLQSFEIMNEGDASFILKMIQKLTNALVMYRYVSEKNNSHEPNPEERFDDQCEQFNTSVQIDAPNTGSSGERPHTQTSCDNEEPTLTVQSTFKRKASHLNTDPSKGNAKSRKLGTYVYTFKEVPNEQQSPDADTQAAPAPDAKMQESSSEKRAPPAVAERKGLPSSEECLSNPTSDKIPSTQSQSAASSTSRPGPSTSDNNIIAEFFNSIRNMEVDEVAATLHKIAASNPAFRGMDVQNVIDILTKSGNLKPQNTKEQQCSMKK